MAIHWKCVPTPKKEYEVYEITGATAGSQAATARDYYEFIVVDLYGEKAEFNLSCEEVRDITARSLPHKGLAQALIIQYALDNALINHPIQELLCLKENTPVQTPGQIQKYES